MNKWCELSIEYANQRSYLDDLFSVYPTIPEGIREINDEVWEKVESAFRKKDNLSLVKNVLNLDLSPIKDSYIAYLKRDHSAIERNPNTVSRISGRLYEMGLNKIYERSSEPKETNRQIGPMFKNWLKEKTPLGLAPVPKEEFSSSDGNAVLSGSDSELGEYASENLGYRAAKGLDLVARFNGKYVIGEAKFLTDFGGHQNAQFNDAKNLLNAKVNKNVIKVAILDGVIYIRGGNKMHLDLIELSKRGCNVMSALLLRDFLYQI